MHTNYAVSSDINVQSRLEEGKRAILEGEPTSRQVAIRA